MSTAELGHVVEVRARDSTELYHRISKMFNIRGTNLLVAEVKHYRNTLNTIVLCRSANMR